MSEEHKTTEPRADRRRWITGVIAALGGTSVLALAASYLRSPTGRFERTVRIGEVDEIFRDRPTRMITVDEETIALVRDPATASITALSMQCTHAGCPLEYHAKKFHCHCHGGTFDLQGQPTAGPPKRSLRTYTVVVVGPTLFLRMGTPNGRTS